MIRQRLTPSPCRCLNRSRSPGVEADLHKAMIFFVRSGVLPYLISCNQDALAFHGSFRRNPVIPKSVLKGSA